MNDPTAPLVRTERKPRMQNARRCPARDAGERDVTQIPLTAREIQILRLIMQGHLNKEIASELTITERTVWFHCGNLFAKLGVERRTQAAMRGYDMGFHLTTELL